LTIFAGHPQMILNPFRTQLFALTSFRTLEAPIARILAPGWGIPAWFPNLNGD